MNIFMFTNTYTPHVGGVAKSVQGFTEELRRLGQRVVVAAPQYADTPENEYDVVRFPSVQHCPEFSFPVPEPGLLDSTLRAFPPDIVHAHHPILLGATALRIAAARDLPLVFTHHTMYENYTHYMQNESTRLKRFAVNWVTGYCNLCDTIIAPSDTVAECLRERGVTTAIRIIPSGVDSRLFGNGDGIAFRRRLGIPDQAFVIGHVGRLAPEKNLSFLCSAVIRCLQRLDHAYFVLVGSGPLAEELRQQFHRHGLAHRFHATGRLEGAALADAYAAMDVFAFTSYSETQGLVLIEAMAAGTPVVAVDACGVREVVRDGYNGKIVRRYDLELFARALQGFATLSPGKRQHYRQEALRTGAMFDKQNTTAQLLDVYRELVGMAPAYRKVKENLWAAAYRRVKGEWQMWSNVARAASDSLRPALVWEIGSGNLSMLTQEETVKPAALTTTVPMVAITLEESRRPGLRARLLGLIWASILRLQSATWKTETQGLAELDQLVASDKKVLFSFWHGKYLPLFALLRGRACCVFTTRSARGDVIAEICRRFGYNCVQIPERGQALDLMREALARHQNGAIAVDGPLGPYHRVKRGGIKLASELGYVIVPASVDCYRKRIVKYRWDRLEIPSLFTRVGLAIGEPMVIPAQLSFEEMQEYTRRLHTALSSLDTKATAMLGKPS